VLLGAEDVEQVRGGINSLAAGKIIDGEEADGERLRLDAKLLSAEGAGELEVFLLAAAGGEKPLAGDFFGDDGGVAGGLPFDADGLDAEIVLGADLEGAGFAI